MRSGSRLKRAPRGRLQLLIFRTVHCPAVPRRAPQGAPWRGALGNIQILLMIYGSSPIPGVQLSGKMSHLPAMNVSVLKYVRKRNNYLRLQKIKKPPCPCATRRGVEPTPIRGWESSYCGSLGAAAPSLCLAGSWFTNQMMIT